MRIGDATQSPELFIDQLVSDGWTLELTGIMHVCIHSFNERVGADTLRFIDQAHSMQIIVSQFWFPDDVLLR